MGICRHLALCVSRRTGRRDKQIAHLHHRDVEQDWNRGLHLVCHIPCNRAFLFPDGRYCTLAHLLELIQTDFYQLFSIIRSVPTADTLIQRFVSALANNSGEQLQGQVDSARIALSTLISPQLYYLLSANDFTLDINNPQAPEIVCLGSNPQKQFIYGAVISLYFSRMLKLVNREGGHPCHIIVDEAASFSAMGMHIAINYSHHLK